MIQLNFEKINSVDLSHLKNIVDREHRKIINGSAGDQHYKLLTYLSKELPSPFIVELGTHYGTSSLALAENKDSVILTYDIKDRYRIKKRNIPKNVIRKIKHIFDNNEAHYLLKADLIFLDAYHQGDFEREVLNYLIEQNFEGIILFDDIHWSQNMIDFWNQIKIEKHDITFLGHGGGLGPMGNISGTGIIDFSKNNLKIT